MKNKDSIAIVTVRDVLTGSGLESIDVEMLLGLVLGKSRSWILAHDDEDVSSEQKKNIDVCIARRRCGEPLASITGMKEFYGRSFIVTRDVLIPRPATESIVRIALEFLQHSSSGPPWPRWTQKIDAGISVYVERLRSGKIETVIDIGTGSGCITLSLALEGVEQSIIGVDTSAGALKIAGRNRKNLGKTRLNVAFVHADGPSFVRTFRKPFLLVSNPPYIPEGTPLETSVADFEPHEALFAGEDGMGVIRPLVRAARENPVCRGMVMEMRSDQIALMSSCLTFRAPSPSPSPGSAAADNQGRGTFVLRMAELPSPD